MVMNGFLNWIPVPLTIDRDFFSLPLDYGQGVMPNAEESEP